MNVSKRSDVEDPKVDHHKILPEAIVKFQEFLAAEPQMTVVNLSKELGVTRQTVYNWLTRHKAGMEISTPGRPRKYVTETSVAVRLRIPHSLAEKLAGSGSERKRSRKLRCELERLICVAAISNDSDLAGALR